jgi:hypothetical protein
MTTLKINTFEFKVVRILKSWDQKFIYSIVMSFAKSLEPNTIKGGGCWVIELLVKFAT